MHVQAPAQGGQEAPAGALLPPQVPVNSSASGATSFELADNEEPDEEQLKRILACKRLSEGNCNRHLANLCRKNSLHFIGESLPPVTEGEPMRHMSHHMSQTGMEGSQSSSTSSSSLRNAGGKHLANKRNSQDDNTNSCSSSTSLDCSGSGGGGLRSPTRRRSSTVSQCSSVLSEGTRQQLNFDLSPDLAPDSSILEANALSPTDFDRPASPEPSSLGSGDGSFDMRPISRMSSQFCDDPLTTEAPSPDSTLGDSTENTTATNTHVSQLMIAMRQQQQQQQQNQRTKDSNEREMNVMFRQQQQQPTNRSTAPASPPDSLANESNGSSGEAPNSEMMTSEKWAAHEQRHQQQQQFPGSVLGQLGNETMTNVADNLERIITHVSEVKVSSNTPPNQLDCRLMETGNGEQHGQHQQQQPGDYLGDCLAMSAGQKRAHTPFGSNIQRNKTTHTEFTG